MGTKYSSVSVSSYNANPPSDDGSTSDSNKVKWSTHKTKLGDPLKTAIEAVNTALVTALDQSARAVTANDSAIASDNDKTIEVNTSSVTITLSDAATMAAGYITTVANKSSGSISVALATASDTIDGTTNATVTIPAGWWRTFLVKAGLNGYLTVGGVVPNNSISGAMIALGSDAQGDVMYYNGTDWARLGAGTSGQFLKTLGTGANPVWASAGITLGTEQATTSGTTIDFTGIPAGTKRITIMLVGVSTNGTSDFMVQLGDSGGFENTGYSSAVASGGATTTGTSGFLVADPFSASNAIHGTIILTLENSAAFTWTVTGTLVEPSAPRFNVFAGSKALSAELTQVRLTTVSTDTFDAGAVNIQYE